MRYPYSCHIKDADTGVMLAADFECEVEISVDRGMPQVDAIYLDGKSLLRSGDQLAVHLAHRVADYAEHELNTQGRLYDRVMAWEAAA